AGPSMVGDFHPLISTGLPAHTEYIYSSFANFTGQYRLQLSIASTEITP
ncbi:peptidase, partial [Klebsiella pneumoniae]